MTNRPFTCELSVVSLHSAKVFKNILDVMFLTFAFLSTAVLFRVELGLCFRLIWV